MKSNNFLRSTLRIARIELNTLFYSPVAWLVLVIFAFQVGMIFSDKMDGYIHYKLMGYGGYAITTDLFSGMRGLFWSVSNYIYLYIPLISMGLMSREYASGSIKLLFSSPISNGSIILGKYLAIFTYGLLLTLILIGYVLFACITVENLDVPFALTGLLGIFLLLCTYSAIGLFMSTITSYQVVAGVGTLAVLTGLNYIGGIGQSSDFIRNLTYWLSIKGRGYEFIEGMLSSEALIYFLAVIAFFITLSIIKLNTDRSVRKRTLFLYGAACTVLLVVALVSSHPKCKFYLDATRSDTNTLADESIDVMKRLDGAMTITSYVNILDLDAYALLPVNRKADLKRFEKYLRFKPEIEMRYVYYWGKCHNSFLTKQYADKTNEELAKIICEASNLNFDKLLTQEQIDEMIDLRSEDYRVVRVVEYGDGQKTLLRMFDDMEKHPSEAEISAAFRCFLDPSPRVGIVSGHSDRTMDNKGGRGYYSFSNNRSFRNSLVNQGFAPEEIDLAEGDVPEGIDIVVLADLRTPLTDDETARLEAYLDRGGNMYLLCDQNRAQNMNPIARKLGFEFGEDLLVAPSQDQDATLLPAVITEQAANIYPQFNKLRNWNYRVAIPGGVEIRPLGGDSLFRLTPLLVSDSQGVWNERETTDFIDDAPVLNPAAGEKEDCYLLAVALSRKVGNKEQRIALVGDSDCISNDGLTAQYWFSATNYSLIDGIFRWMSYEQFPIDISHPEPIDNAIRQKKAARSWNKIAMLGIVPGLLLLAGLWLIIKRQRG